MNAFRLPASREWPLPGRRLFVAVRNLWTEAEEIHAWYEKSYREAYQRYHKFVAAFYACNDEPDSTFWSKRKIDGAKDAKFEGKQWFSALTGETVDADAAGGG